MANITKVYLLQVPLEKDYKNTLYFGSAAAQQQYFQSRIVKSYTDFSYQRKDKLIRIPDIYDNIATCNYVMYQNTAYSNKWYYAFIDHLEYINDGNTNVFIETDVIQTWMFDYTVRASFVAREHVDNDRTGLHTVPENLETGELIVNERVTGRPWNALTIVVGATIDLLDSENDYPDINGSLQGGIYNGLKYYYFTSVNTLNNLLASVAGAGRSDGIVSVFMVSNQFFDWTMDQDTVIGVVSDSSQAKTVTWELAVLGGDSITAPSKPTTVNGYTPRNNKLLTYPYSYLLASNNSGANAIYKYELFSSQKCDFQYQGVLCPGMSIRLQPLNYNNQSINNDEGLNLGKFPICSWNTDVYTNWLTQNGLNIAVSLVGGTTSAIAGAGAVAGGVMGLIPAQYALMGSSSAVGGINQIATTLQQVHQQAFAPPQAEGNTNNGDVTYSSGFNRIDLFKMSIKKEFAEIIDGYFDMFGYQVNKVKVPNKNHRLRWWYTQTIDAFITGNIPQADLEIIRKCYDSGITFWRNASELGDYSLPNPIDGIG